MLGSCCDWGTVVVWTSGWRVLRYPCQLATPNPLAPLPARLSSAIFSTAIAIVVSNLSLQTAIKSPSQTCSRTSLCRTKNIETWDMRRLPSRPTHEPPPGLPLPRLRAPPHLADLACPANSPDFWVEPHGLCVAVHGAPRHSQRFGAKHAFWPWPRQTGGVATVSTDPAAPACSARGGGGGVEIPGRCVVVPGVVNDSGYRMCLSTGVKFTDTHMATVLDSSRVLVDEMSAMPRVARGSGDREGEDVTSLFLAA